MFQMDEFFFFTGFVDLGVGLVKWLYRFCIVRYGCKETNKQYKTWLFTIAVCKKNQHYLYLRMFQMEWVFLLSADL